MNLLVMSSVTKELKIAIIQPLSNGIIIAKINGKTPNEKNAFSFLPLVIPISKRKIARKPLNKSFVNGLIPSACFAFAINPISQLPRINRTLPLVNECFITDGIFILVLISSLLKIEINMRPMIIAGDSIKAIIATIWP